MTNNWRKNNIFVSKTDNNNRRAYKMGIKEELLVEDVANLFYSQQVCYYCDCSLDIHNFTIDHIKALSAGGSNNINNIVIACLECNQMKDKLPLEFFLKKVKQIYQNRGEE